MISESNWAFFDSVRIINLFSRLDRYEAAKEECTKIGLSSKAKFHLAYKDEEDNKRGCFKSHIDVISDAYRRGDGTCLIFEDDFRVSPFPKDLVSLLHQA